MTRHALINQNVSIFPSVEMQMTRSEAGKSEKFQPRTTRAFTIEIALRRARARHRLSLAGIYLQVAKPNHAQMGDFGSNRAAWLIAGFLGRKFMKVWL